MRRGISLRTPYFGHNLVCARVRRAGACLARFCTNFVKSRSPPLDGGSRVLHSTVLSSGPRIARSFNLVAFEALERFFGSGTNNSPVTCTQLVQLHVQVRARNQSVISAPLRAALKTHQEPKETTPKYFGVFAVSISTQKPLKLYLWSFLHELWAETRVRAHDVHFI